MQWVAACLSKFIELLEDTPQVSEECLRDIAVNALMPKYLLSIAEERGRRLFFFFFWQVRGRRKKKKKSPLQPGPEKWGLPAGNFVAPL